MELAFSPVDIKDLAPKIGCYYKTNNIFGFIKCDFQSGKYLSPSLIVLSKILIISVILFFIIDLIIRKSGHIFYTLELRLILFFITTIILVALLQYYFSIFFF